MMIKTNQYVDCDVCVCAGISSRLFQKQQELEPVVTAVTNESTEIMIDSGNTSQSQPIEGGQDICLLLYSGFANTEQFSIANCD